MLKYFFLAGHAQYARYIAQYLRVMTALPDEAKSDIVASALVCRHHDGQWNAVSSDQFGEQTAIKIGKGALKGMTLSPELVSDWIDSFPIRVHVSDNIEHIYSENQFSQQRRAYHKEESKTRRVSDAHDRNLIANAYRSIHIHLRTLEISCSTRLLGK